MSLCFTGSAAPGGTVNGWADWFSDTTTMRSGYSGLQSFRDPFLLQASEMSDPIKDNKLVELSYKITDAKSGQVLSAVEFPIAYVHGHNDILAPQVLEELEGKSVGDIIEVPIDCNTIFGPRDETLVFTDLISNVPEEYREIGTTITMENDKGEAKNFIVTRMDDETLTVDGNNPMCGREVVFTLEILSVRDASDEEIEGGGKDNDGVSLDEALMTQGLKAHSIN